jgi:dTDP-4-dehydrorhamnose reductase
MRRHLIIGGSGLIGRHIYNELKRLDEHVVAGDRHYGTFIDITQPESVHATIRTIQPDVVFLTAANTDVDACERDPAASYETNVQGVKNVVEAIQAQNGHASLVFFSSAYVFNGLSDSYLEDNIPNPVNIYGRHKLLAEHIVATGLAAWTIVRVVHVYGEEALGKNFVYSVLKRLRAKEPVYASHEEFGTPVHAKTIASAVVTASEYADVLHIPGPSVKSRFEFAQDIAATWGLDRNLVIARPRSGGAPRPPKCNLASHYVQPEPFNGLQDMKDRGV